MKATELRTLIKESIQEYIKEIDEAGNRAALEAKIAKTQEAIENRKKKINMEGLDEAYHDMMDKGKIKELTSEIKLLEKSLTKYGKMLEKMDAKSAPKQMEDEGMMDEEVIDEVSVDELTLDPNAGPQLEEESLEEDQLDEAKKKPSAGMTKKEKSALSKKAHAGKDIGKKGKGFEKVAKAGEKQYGSKEAGEKVAAAAMWKAAAKKESVETEGEVINESFLHMQKLAGLITEAEYKAKLDTNNEDK